MAYSQSEMLTAVAGSKGRISIIANRMGCTRKTVYSHIENDPVIADAIEDEKQKRGDWAESKLDQRIEEGSDACLIFMLKCQFKDRGYIERQELTGADGAPIFNIHIGPDNGPSGR